MADPVGSIVLNEYQETQVPQSLFGEDLARYLDAHHSGVIDIQPPSYRNQNLWTLCPQGWVGFIPLPGHPGLSLQPKVQLANIFRMLEYAYDLNSFRLLHGLFNAHSIRDFFDQLSGILVRRTLERVSRGLYRHYEERNESLALVRGRLDMGRISRDPTLCLLPCIYQEHTTDVDDNRILAWTLHVLCSNQLLSQARALEVRKVERLLRSMVSLRPYQAADCVGRTYNRLNEDYRVLHGLCRFILDNIGPTQQLGETSMVPFLVNMARLFELFVARWLHKNLPSGYLIHEQEVLNVDAGGTVSMRIDLVLYKIGSEHPLCVIDTKYKVDGKAQPADYNQVVAYALNKKCSKALLVYPKPLHAEFVAEGHIGVRSLTFDLSKDPEDAGKLFLSELMRAVEG